MKDTLQKAFDFASMTVKQLITLATGIIALTITFSKDLIGSVPESAIPFLKWSWFLYLVSIICGVWTLMALTGSLEPEKDKSKDNDRNSTKDDFEPSIRNTNVTLPIKLQVFSFLAGTILIVIFGIKSM